MKMPEVKTCDTVPLKSKMVPWYCSFEIKNNFRIKDDCTYCYAKCNILGRRISHQNFCLKHEQIWIKFLRKFFTGWAPNLLKRYKQKMELYSEIPKNSYRIYSVLRIRDVYTGSQIRFFFIPDPGSKRSRIQIRIKDPGSRGQKSTRFRIRNSKSISRWKGYPTLITPFIAWHVDIFIFLCILTNTVRRFTGYGQGLILCQLLPGKEYKGMDFKPAGYDSKLVLPDATSGWSCSIPRKTLSHSDTCICCCVPALYDYSVTRVAP